MERGWVVRTDHYSSVAADAADATATGKPTVLVDGGIENFNSAVDEVVASGILKRVLAQTEINFSNSLIESWWRILKHQWPYLNTLDTVATIEKLVTFYVAPFKLPGPDDG